MAQPGPHRYKPRRPYLNTEHASADCLFLHAFWEAGGTRSLDLAGNGFDGVAESSGPTATDWQDGPDGPAWGPFDGTAEGVLIGTGNVPTFDEYTLLTRFYAPADGVGAWSNLFSINGATDKFDPGITDNTGSFSVNGFSPSFNGTATYAEDTWHTFVYSDKAAGAGAHDIRIFHDGVFEEEITAAFWGHPCTNVSTDEVIIGGDGPGNEVSGCTFSICAFWLRAMSDAEAIALSADPFALITPVPHPIAVTTVAVEAPAPGTFLKQPVSTLLRM